MNLLLKFYIKFWLQKYYIQADFMDFLSQNHYPVTKYRQKVLYGMIRSDIREIIRKLCAYKKVEIIEGAVCIDHVHLCLSIPPKESVSSFMGYLKGRSAIKIFEKHPELKKKWHNEFWATGYFVTTVGDITEEVAKKYIREQEKEDKKLGN